MSKEITKKLFENFMQHATPQDEAVMLLLLNGFQKKQQGQFSRYIDSTLHMERQFTEDTSTITIPITPVIHNYIQTPHGGIIATIADAAMGELATQSLPDGFNVVTTNMNINYLQTTTNNQLIAKGSFIRKGRTFIVMECVVEDETGKMLATASASFYVVKIRK